MKDEYCGHVTRCRVPIGPHLALGVEGEHLLAELVALPVGGGEGVEGGAVGDGAGPGEEILKAEEEVVWVAGVRLLIVVFFNLDINLNWYLQHIWRSCLHLVCCQKHLLGLLHFKDLC